MDALRVYDYSTSHERRMDGKMGQRHPPRRRGVGRFVEGAIAIRDGWDDVDGCGCTYSKGFLGYERFIHRWMGWDGVGSLVSFGFSSSTTPSVVDSTAHRGVGDPTRTNERTRGKRSARVRFKKETKTSRGACVRARVDASSVSS